MDEVACSLSYKERTIIWTTPSGQTSSALVLPTTPTDLFPYVCTWRAVACVGQGSFQQAERSARSNTPQCPKQRIYVNGPWKAISMPYIPCEPHRADDAIPCRASRAGTSHHVGLSSARKGPADERPLLRPGASRVTRYTGSLCRVRHCSPRVLEHLWP